jgi:nucleoside-diphosphate-sugar epimerase
VEYLITGGAGFIGSHLADRLVERGDRVVLVDNLSTGSAENVAHLVEPGTVDLVEVSILDEDLTRKLVGEADVVVHLAASVGVQLIVQHPLDSLINNIRGTEMILEACADFGTKVMVTSTSEIYGKNASGPLHEDADRILGSPFVARWSYSTAKAVDEILANAYWRERGTPTIVVRLFNTVGPRQTGAYGMVVPRFVGQALQGKPLTVFGTGAQRRCFCHVQDTVSALLALLDHPGAVGSVFNVGAPNETSMEALAHRVIELTGSASELVHVPYDVAYEEGFEDMERRVPDINRIRDLTDWEPRRSLDDILHDVIADLGGRASAAPVAERVAEPMS